MAQPRRPGDRPDERPDPQRRGGERPAERQDQGGQTEQVPDPLDETHEPSSEQDIGLPASNDQ